MKSTLLVVLAAPIFLHAPSAFAIKGAYMPTEELSKSVCKIVVGRLTQTYLPTYENGYANGKAPYVFEDLNVDMCSSTLIAPNAILTAAHCFTGTNEQDVARGSFPYPKMVEGKLIPGCDPKAWYKNPKCIAGKEFGIVKNKWEDVKVVCPTPDGKTEERTIIEDSGYPNPLFKADGMVDSITHSNFDVTVWRFEKPITTTPVSKIELDERAGMEAIKANSQTCRSFGYGLDNDEKTGTLRGTFTPISKASKAVLLSDLASTQYSDNPNGRTDHGDSGGALICKSSDGEDKLFGVISRGGPSSRMETMTLSDISIFAKTTYNASWIKKVLKEAPLVRPHASEWWDKFVLQYEIDQLQLVFTEIGSCVKNSVQFMSRDDAQYINFGLGGLQDRYKKAVKEYHFYGDDSGLLRIKVRQIFADAQGLSWECQKASGE